MWKFERAKNKKDSQKNFQKVSYISKDINWPQWLQLMKIMSKINEMKRNKEIITFTSVGQFLMVVDTMSKPINPLRVVWECYSGIFLVKFRNNFYDH